MILNLITTGAEKYPISEIIAAQKDYDEEVTGLKKDCKEGIMQFVNENLDVPKDSNQAIPTVVSQSCNLDEEKSKLLDEIFQ